MNTTEQIPIFDRICGRLVRMASSRGSWWGHISACVLLLWLAGCDEHPIEKHAGQRSMMGSFGTVTAYSRDSKLAGTGISTALMEMERVDKLMSHYKPESDVSRISRLAGQAAVNVSLDTLQVVQASIGFGLQTDGAFDITITPLVKSWGFFKHEKHIPSLTEIREKRELVDFRRIAVDAEKRTVMAKKANMALDLGGIAKGYAVDLAAKAIRAQGITSGLANLSNSTFFAIGSPPDQSAWKIAIQHPRKKNALLGTISINDEALATSADSEQFFIHDGVRYGHILDPRTGYPVSNGIVSTTVVAPTGMEADALATAVFVLGSEKGMALIRNRADVEVIIVREAASGELIIEVPRGLKARFEPVQSQLSN